jgi:hypothetical protein
MGKLRLPESLRQFVERQKTMPIADLWDGDLQEQDSPYGSCWYRAVACILLSGRVKAKYDGAPNMTDVNRVGKEANFNQYLTERVGKFLVALEAVRFDHQGRYEAGPSLAAFWAHDGSRLSTFTRQAVLRLVRYQTGDHFRHPRNDDASHLIAFLSLFFACFRGLALVESEVGQVFHDFSSLPPDDLLQGIRGLGLVADGVDAEEWQRFLDDKGRKALVSALYTAEWAYFAKPKQAGWWFASPIGLAMLGLEPPPPTPELATVFQAQADLTVFAGAGLGWEKLVPLFRYGTIRRIDQVFEFRLDRKRIAAAPATSAPGEELREVLRELEPLPSTVADLLATKPKVGGKVGIRWCSALIKPESPEALAAIREHPRLKGYLEPGAPPGYLLLKSRSDPGNFVQRCRDLGFEVTSL